MLLPQVGLSLQLGSECIQGRGCCYLKLVYLYNWGLNAYKVEDVVTSSWFISTTGV